MGHLRALPTHRTRALIAASTLALAALGCGRTPAPNTRASDVGSAGCDEGHTACLDTHTLGVCGDDGGYTAQPCALDERCIFGACVVFNTRVCEDGARMCDGEAAFVVCQDGAWSPPAACPRAHACSSGSCDPTAALLPDLHTERVTVTDQEVFVGERFEVLVDVSNGGDGGTGEFMCGLYASRADDGATSTLRMFRLPDLSPGDRWSEGVQAAIGPRPGRYTLSVTCDPDQTLDERDETNNTAQASAHVAVIDPDPQDADLILEDAELERDTIAQDAPLALRYTITNAGPAALDAGVTCTLALGDDPDRAERAEPIAHITHARPLPPGASAEHQRDVLTLEALPLGDRFVFLTCVPLGRDDPNTANNTALLGPLRILDPLDAAPPNAVVTQVTAGAAIALFEQPAALSAEVCNHGQGRIQGGRLAFDITSGSAPNTALAADVAHAELGQLNPGQCALYDTAWPEARCFDGEFDRPLYARARVDALNSALPDASPDDDVAYAEDPFYVSGCAQGICRPDPYDSNSTPPHTPLPFDEPLALCDGDQDTFTWRPPVFTVDYDVLLTIDDLDPDARVELTTTQRRRDDTDLVRTTLLTSEAPSVELNHPTHHNSVLVQLRAVESSEINAYSLSWAYAGAPPARPDLAWESITPPRREPSPHPHHHPPRRRHQPRGGRRRRPGSDRGALDRQPRRHLWAGAPRLQHAPARPRWQRADHLRAAHRARGRPRPSNHPAHARRRRAL